jgi:hypothetical protein
MGISAQPNNVPVEPSFAYATPDALVGGGWLTTTPTNVAALLRSATMVVAEAAERNPYTDTPSAADALVLADATCAQVAAWVSAGVDPTNPVTEATVKERAFDTARFVYDTTGQAQARTAALTKISDEARRILYVGGLLSVPLPVGTSPFDVLPTYGLPTTLGGIGFDPFGWEAARDAGYGAVGGGYLTLPAAAGTAETTTRPPVTITGDYQAHDGDDILADATSNPIVITLDPEPAGHEVSVKKIDPTTNTVTVRAYNGALIDGQPQYVIAMPFMSIDLLSDGTNLFLH